MEVTQIGSIAIDFDKEQVFNSLGNPIEFRPQTFSVFSYLCKNRGRVVTKNELLDSVWDGVVVTDDSIVKCISEIRKALDVSSSIDLKTVTRRGYLLTESMVLADTSESRNVELPTIAVIPFTGLSEDAAAFAAGLAEDVTTHLSTQKDIFVLASHSASAYKASEGLESAKAVCDALNVRYLLQGTIQKVGSTHRANIQLSDAESNTQVWSDRLVETDSNIFDAQDRLSATIVNRISGTAGILMSVERNQLQRDLPSNPEAYELYILASNIDKSLSREGLASSIKLYEKAVKLAPSFSRAWMRLASLHLFSAACAYTDDLESTVEQFIACALQAVEIDSNDSLSQALAGGAYCFMGEMTKGRESFDRALSLGPNNADTLALVAYIRPTKFATVSKDLENVRRAKSLNPYYPMWYSLAHGYCAYHAGEYLESIESLNHADADIPDTQLYLMLSYVESGEPKKADTHKQKLLALNPDVTVAALIEGDAMQDESIVAHFNNSAKKAGIPA